MAVVSTLDLPIPSAWDLVEGEYVEAGRAVGDDTVRLARPFPVAVTHSG